MPENPPEDLKRRVDELAATVRGLTQELVEANERIRLLEDRLDDRNREEEAPANKPISPGNRDTNGEKSTDDETEHEQIEDDIIVA